MQLSSFCLPNWTSTTRRSYRFNQSFLVFSFFSLFFIVRFKRVCMPLCLEKYRFYRFNLSKKQISVQWIELIGRALVSAMNGVDRNHLVQGIFVWVFRMQFWYSFSWSVIILQQHSRQLKMMSITDGICVFSSSCVCASVFSYSKLVFSFHKLFEQRNLYRLALV